MSHAGWGEKRFKRVNTCHPERKHYANGLCRGCYQNTPAHKARRHRYYKKHIAKWQAETARATLTRKQSAAKYGLTSAEVLAMTQQQQGRCAICGDPPKKKQLAIDHCHKTGKVRALLCHPCNGALGLFRDDEARLELAIAYLRAHRGDDPLRAETAPAGAP